MKKNQQYTFVLHKKGMILIELECRKKQFKWKDGVNGVNESIRIFWNILKMEHHAN